MSFFEALAFGQAQLDEIAGRFDVPIDGKAPECVAVLGVVLHARQVFRSVLRDCAAGDIPTAMLSLRALAEATILIRWIEVSATNHVEMWEAEADRQNLTVATNFDEMNRRRGWQAARPPVFTQQQVRETRQSIRRVRAAAVARGEPLSKSKTASECLPTIERMAHDTKDSAIWEVYEIVYRIASPWAHVSERVLTGYQLQVRSDGTHIVPEQTWTGQSIRTVAVPGFAILLGSASRICGLGVDGECRIIQDALAGWPPQALSEVQPQRGGG
jgi:hypothetical protein